MSAKTAAVDAWAGAEKIIDGSACSACLRESCLGNCALSPAVLMDHDLHGRVTPERADRIIDAARSSR